MKAITKVLMIFIILIFVGCNPQSKTSSSEQSGSNHDDTSQDTNSKDTSMDSDDTKQNLEELQTDQDLKKANWVIEIDDTQQITDTDGLIWNYTLSLYASKMGGTDVNGIYTGEAILNMEPDFESAQALAAREGSELLAMFFKHHSVSQNFTFEIVPYSADVYSKLMKENSDNPLLRFDDPESKTEGLAITQITFLATQEPLNMTIRDDGEVMSGSVPGGGKTVTVPIVISTEGAIAWCHIYDTVHPLNRTFKGVIAGDVLE